MEKEISVRHLVEFILKTGDLISETSSKHSAQAGTKIHQKIQKENKKNLPHFQEEITVSYAAFVSGTEFLCRGRVDGLYEEEKIPIVQEIKTSETLFSDLSEKEKEVFFAQGKCYAYFLAKEHHWDVVTVELLYIEVISQKQIKERQTFSKEELKEFFFHLLEEYAFWYEKTKTWEDNFKKSTENLPFPYATYRKGQRELMSVVYKSLLLKKQLFLQAPTGTGKTLSTLYPALLAQGQGKFPTLFYLTAKTITRQVVEDSLFSLEKKQLALHSVTITAKDKICFCKKAGIAKNECPFAKGYYDRVNEGLMDILEHERIMTREVIEEYAKKHQLCPFEFSLDISLFCQVIVADYNYVYDPTVYLRRFFDNITEKNAPLLLVDEAHNLVNRSKEMYSASLSLNETKRIYQEIKKVKGSDSFTKKLRRRFLKFQKHFSTLAQQEGDFFTGKVENSFLNELQGLLEALFEWTREKEVNEEILNWAYEGQKYLKISEFFNENFVLGFERVAGDFFIRQLCLDPNEFLQNINEACYNSVLFSATLMPLKYYESRLGKVDGVNFSLASPFKKENLQVIIADYIQTTYQERENNLAKICAAIEAMSQEKIGNYFVFCPSYAFMEQIIKSFPNKEQVEIIKQEKDMSERQREEFLKNFTLGKEKSLLAFALVGGIFSEGIDLVGEKLLGCAIVGVGLSQVNPITNLEKAYYDEKNGQGFAYSYQLPGINKVLQAAGRVIRSSNDYGVVLLLDARYKRKDYFTYLPDYWQIGLGHNLTGIKEGLHEFWKNKE